MICSQILLYCQNIVILLNFCIIMPFLYCIASIAIILKYIASTIIYLLDMVNQVKARNFNKSLF